MKAFKNVMLEDEGFIVSYAANFWQAGAVVGAMKMEVSGYRHAYVGLFHDAVHLVLGVSGWWVVSPDALYRRLTEGLPRYGNEEHATIVQMDVSPDEFLEVAVFRDCVTDDLDAGAGGYVTYDWQWALFCLALS